MNDFEFLKTSLRSLIDKMENDSYYDLETSVDALCSIARYYEKMGGDYKRRVKLNKEFKADVINFLTSKKKGWD